MTSLLRKSAAELIGTATLVFFAVGSAVFGGDQVSVVGVALAFGFVLVALAYAIGPVSGCHVNPAVTLGVLLRGGITLTVAGAYWVSQVVGAIVGAGGIALLLTVGGVTDRTGAKGTNNWGETINLGGTFLLEIILTFLLVLVVLLVTARDATPGFAGLAIGVTLTVVHLVGIPLDGTSVNPARSLGPALFQGGDAFGHVWVFLLAPLIGAVLAAVSVPLLTAPAEKVAAVKADSTSVNPARTR